MEDLIRANALLISEDETDEDEEPGEKDLKEDDEESEMFSDWQEN